MYIIYFQNIVAYHDFLNLKKTNFRIDVRLKKRPLFLTILIRDLT